MEQPEAVAVVVMATEAGENVMANNTTPRASKMSFSQNRSRLRITQNIFFIYKCIKIK